MANKNTFASAKTRALPANTNNEAGGRSYVFSAQHALAQYAATGTFNQTFYACEGEQLQKVLELALAVSPEFVAKTAVYARERGLMKDMPAFLAAVLAARDIRMLERIFPRVIDNGKMLRNFVQMVRSGVAGRKSFGSAPKRLLRRWFQTRTPENIFRQSVGSAPSLKDVIKMVRPSPKLGAGEADAVREALYGYLIGKDVAREKLPSLVQAFETFKEVGFTGTLPDVPLEMLTSVGAHSGTAFWASLAKQMTFTQLRMNLVTLARHGVFEDDEMVKHVVSTLSNADLVKRSRVQPYALLSAFKASIGIMPSEVSMALQAAMEIAIESVPITKGRIVVCPDVSGSMHSPATGYRKGASSTVRCIDVAALASAAFLRRNPGSHVMPFSDDVVPLPQPLNPLDSVMTNATLLSSLPSGGTACSAPLRALNKARAKADLVVYVSDNMSWTDFQARPSAKTITQRLGLGTRATVMAEEWEIFRTRNPEAKLVLIDVQPYSSTQMYDRADVLNVGGFSDAVFDLVSRFANGETSSELWVSEIERVVV